MGNNNELERFSKLLDVYPAGFTGNRLNLLFVQDAEPITEGVSYLKRLNDLSLMEERREYLVDDQCYWPFPRTRLDARPDPVLLSEHLFARFETACRLIVAQEDIGSMLEKRVRSTDPAIVLMVIVDGLSYYDVPEDEDMEPCLVKGVSTTEHGYRAVTGNPSISRRLFALGYTDQIGFTYYSPENDDLSASVYDAFSPSQVVRVKAFDEAVAQLKTRRMSRGYVQVTLSGLDQIVHHHTDRPPREYYTQQILSRFERLIACLKGKRRRILACLTADHGILWRDVVEGHLEMTDDLFREDAYHPRYVKGALLRPYCRCVQSFGQSFALLKFPWMTRCLRNDEWGVHGGLSAWESLVPLIWLEA